MENLALGGFYSGKKIFLTGHTGFKGCWLGWWLKELGAEVTGFSLPPEDLRGNLFNLTGLGGAIRSLTGDIRDLSALQNALRESQASIVFHLAAQPIVLRSYQNPVETYQSNVMGTINLLEAVRNSPTVKTVVVVTTDKCYENKEWPWPYREIDPLGGHDPYSSSKAMVEIAVSAYRRSFLAEKGVGLASARAGNVVGGGDFAPYRIIPDIVEALGQNRPVILRNPDAVRPWNHVLDALRGYLTLACCLDKDPVRFSGPFNFSPRDTSSEHSVLNITREFIRVIGRGSYEISQASPRAHEAAYLSLDPGKALRELGWRCLLTTGEALGWTAQWYQAFLENPAGAGKRTMEQIQEYMKRIVSGDLFMGKYNDQD